MIIRIAFLLSVFLLSQLGSERAFAQSPASAEFHARIIALYSFQPHGLNGDELTAKSADLDAFWSDARANAQDVLPLLREALADPSGPSFFFYDGAKLLLSLSEARADRELALRSLPKVDLRDVQRTDYLITIHWFASQGFDTREAAFRILAYPDFQAFIVQHALTLGQDYSLIYMLFPLQGIPFESDLISRLDTERDVTAQKSLLLALWYTVTPTGTAAIKRFSERAGVEAEVAALARELLARRPDSVHSPAASVESLRQQRARLMQRAISDEALIEFDALTEKLLAKQWKHLSHG